MDDAVAQNQQPQAASGEEPNWEELYNLVCMEKAQLEHILRMQNEQLKKAQNGVDNTPIEDAEIVKEGKKKTLN